MIGPRVGLLAKKSVAPSQRSSAGWMAEGTGRLSIGVGRRHPMTMRKASYRTPSITQVFALQYQTSALYSSAK